MFIVFKSKESIHPFEDVAITLGKKFPEILYVCEILKLFVNKELPSPKSQFQDEMIVFEEFPEKVKLYELSHIKEVSLIAFIIGVG